MRTFTAYGPGGYCADCTPDHDHPLNNIVEVIELPDDETTPTVQEQTAQLG